MARDTIGTIRQRLAPLAAFALGAGATVTACLLVMRPDELSRNWPLWGALGGFLILTVMVLWFFSGRMQRIEEVVDSRTADLREANAKLEIENQLRREAEAATAQEALFPKLNPGLVMSVDAEGIILKANPAAKTLFGHDVSGSNLAALLPTFKALGIKDCIRNDAVRTGEGRMRGRTYFFTLRGIPSAAMAMVFATDITERREAEEALAVSEARTRAILNSAADPIVIVLEDGTLQSVNPATERQFGFTEDELEPNGRITMLLPDLFAQDCGSYVDALVEYRNSSTGGTGGAVFGQRKDGSRVPLDLTISEFEVLHERKVSVIMHDITERMNYEELLLRQSKKVADQNRALGLINRELEEFNYVASHDLQEPLRTLSAYCGLLERDIGEELSDRAREDIHFILDASLRMQTLIRDLLEFSRSGHSDVRMVEIDLDQVMRRVKTDLKASLGEVSGTLKWSDLPMVTGDPMQIGRVLQNLVSNALKFRGERDPVVDVSADRIGDTVRVSVRDNGIGIESQYLEKVFAPFQRLHGIGKYEGSGIGLAVCRKIMERHGGSITGESVPGKGSVFLLTFPPVQVTEASE